MAATGEEPVGSMGNDTPLAVLSDRPQLLFAYFKQLFAQVTNPAIDPIREQLVMSLAMNLGAQRNLLDESPAHARQLRLRQPILDEPGIAALRTNGDPALRTTTLRSIWAPKSGAAGMSAAVELLCRRAAGAIRNGSTILILSDRGVGDAWAPIPSLLAVGAVHHHLIREGLRARASLVAESGEAREVSHFALLITHGAAAVCPYLAFEVISQLASAGALVGVRDESSARAAYVKAIGKGLLKVLSKMGISTLQSYCGAQICEAVGLDRDFVARHFAGTASRIGGIGIDIVADETLRRHRAATTTIASRASITTGIRAASRRFSTRRVRAATRPSRNSAERSTTRTGVALRCAGSSTLRTPGSLRFPSTTSSRRLRS
jgi:hypothetical protein